MNLLDANDRPGAYPDSWYAATARTLPRLDPLSGDHRADVCVVGGGFTGLSAALHLAEAGFRVILLEAQRIGFGASGRNGGQLGSGQRVAQDVLEAQLGPARAAQYWTLGEEAKNLVKSLIARFDIACDLKPGVAWTESRPEAAAQTHRYADFLQERYGYTQIEKLDRDACHALCPSPDYCGGILDHGAAHLHPLNFALGLARAAISAGAELHEGSRVEAIHEGARLRLRTKVGTVEAAHVVLACNGYLGKLNPQVARHVMPINNFIAATAPLEAPERVLGRDVAIADGRFVVNYFRLSQDNRLLFGGGESYGYRFPANIDAVVRKPMARIFPHLADIPFDYTWGGTLAITLRRMPYLARPGRNILSASGYSGHGIGTATHAGLLMAKAIGGQAEGFDTMALLPRHPFPGGPRLRAPLLALAMSWYALRDRLGI